MQSQLLLTLVKLDYASQVIVWRGDVEIADDIYHDMVDEYGLLWEQSKGQDTATLAPVMRQTQVLAYNIFGWVSEELSN